MKIKVECQRHHVQVYGTPYLEPTKEPGEFTVDTGDMVCPGRTAEEYGCWNTWEVLVVE